MLRLLVLLLVLANGVFFAWSQGLLAGAGFAPTVQSEPQRLAQQIKPEALRLLTPAEARQTESPSSGATAAATDPGASAAAPQTECLQAGLFNEEQTAALRTRLQSALPNGSWVLESSVEPARWLVYMGKYAGADALAKKRSELRGLGVSFEALNNPSLEPGLSLGNFSTQADAEAEMARISRRGVRTAKVIQERAEVRGQRLRLASVDAALKTQLEPLRGQLEGKTLQACH
jgi:hypothetical protein